MARLIDADILKENCRITGKFMNNFECVSLKTLGEIIDKQPTIDPVKRGKWDIRQRLRRVAFLFCVVVVERHIITKKITVLTAVQEWMVNK